MVSERPPSTDVVAPICSVCIANYNGERTLRACIDSILAQDLNGAVQIIVHDDASTDTSLSILIAEYPDTHLLISSENVGYCISNNRMARKATGKYLLLLNNDATLLPGALAYLYEHSEARTQTGIFGLPQYLPDGTLIDRGNLLDLSLNPVPNLDPNIRSVGLVIGACFWLPLELWKELGGFPEWFESLAEDMFVCLYARLKGHYVEVLPESGFRHEVGASFGGGKVTSGRLNSTFRRRRLSERNKTFTMITCFPARLLAFALPVHLLALLLEGAILTLMKRDTRIWTEIYWACVRAIWSHRARLYRTRRHVQKHAIPSFKDFVAPIRYIPHKVTMLIRYGVPGIYE